MRSTVFYVCAANKVWRAGLVGSGGGVHILLAAQATHGAWWQVRFLARARHVYVAGDDAETVAEVVAAARARGRLPTLHPTPYTLSTLHPTPSQPYKLSNLHPTRYTLHPTPYILDLVRAGQDHGRLRFKEMFLSRSAVEARDGADPSLCFFVAVSNWGEESP